MASPNTLFSRLWKANLLVLVIPFVISLVLAQVSVSILETEARKSNLATLEQTSGLIDSRFQELDSLVKQVALDPKVKAFLGLKTIEDSDQTSFDVWALTKSLPNFALTNSFIDKYFIYSSTLEAAVSNEEALMNNPLDFTRVFQYGTWNFATWNQFFLKTSHQKRVVPRAQLKIGAVAMKGLYYLQSLPLEFRQAAPLGQVLFFINEKTIQGSLKTLDVGDEGIVLVLDEQGDIVSSITSSWTNERQTALAARIKEKRPLGLDDSRFLVSRAVSTSTGWTYVSVLPQDLVLAPVLFVRNLVILAFLVAVALSFLVTWVLARRSAKPIETEFQGLHETLRLQTPVMKADLLRRLFSGQLTDAAEIETRSRASDLPLKAKVLAAALLRIEGYEGLLPTKTLEEIDLVKAFLRERLGAQDSLTVYWQDDQNRLQLLLLSHTAARPELFTSECAALLEGLSETLSQELHATFQWSLGDPVEHAGEVGHSYQQARDRLFAPLGLNPVQGPHWFHYPLETEMRLVSFLKKGNRDGVELVLDQIQQDNLVERSLKPAMFYALMASLYASVVRVLPPELSATIDLDSHTGDPQVLLEGFRQQTLRLCSEIGAGRADEVSAKLRDINEYLHLHLADPNLTLFQVARQFSMTESFFYHFYRDHSAKSFADALESFRIERACELLTEGTLKIHQILSQTGFTTPSTFRRAFRRVMGMAPSDFRPHT